MTDRRSFIKKTALGAAAIGVGGVLPGFSARSYNSIMGANDLILLSSMGINSRGKAIAGNFAKRNDCRIIHLCDVDSRAIDKCRAQVFDQYGQKPKGIKDFRKSLDSKDVDAVIIATPDHWHAPMAMLALKAGKNVYVEKPCSHNPNEGEMLAAGAGKYNKVVQMGNQRRSWPNVRKAIEEVHSGTIGKVYFGKSWYTANRGPIGIGREVAVPKWLDWDLWQGPAPRKAFKDNYIHYNWHWFWHWGTGEALNNGTHMVDLLRWGLNVEYPVRVSSNGGRFCYDDDWETPDTQVITMDFAEGVTLTWEGRSCSAKTVENEGVGAQFFGDKGSIIIGGGNNYRVFDVKGRLVKDVKQGPVIDPRNPSDPSASLDDFHFDNFLNAIRSGEKLNSDIDGGYKSTLLVQLGNIAQRVHHSLDIDPANGHILNDRDAQALWSREYEKGWEMTL